MTSTISPIVQGSSSTDILPAAIFDRSRTSLTSSFSVMPARLALVSHSRAPSDSGPPSSRISAW